jgi:hypothetical protein
MDKNNPVNEALQNVFFSLDSVKEKALSDYTSITNKSENAENENTYDFKTTETLKNSCLKLIIEANRCMTEAAKTYALLKRDDKGGEDEELNGGGHSSDASGLTQEMMEAIKKAVESKDNG